MTKPVKKRGPGKKKADVGVSTMYHAYRKHLKGKNQTRVNYSQYSELIDECNKKIKSLLIDEAEIVKLPFKLGFLHVHKWEAEWFDNKFWPVDFKASKDNGFRVLHKNAVYYPIRWGKLTKGNYYNKQRYKFTPCRQIKRDLAYNIKVKKQDYFA
jgi:hypothetical protein